MNEYLLESPDGGSIGACAPNPCGTPEGNQELALEVFRGIYDRGERMLGRAVFAAKCSVIARFPNNDHYYGNAYLYTLFGDPALRLRYPVQTGVEAKESPAEVPTTHRPAIVRGSLYLPGTVRADLVSVTGRRVAMLAPGTNDIDEVAPGVYFIPAGPGRPAGKVLIVR